ncbi:Extracellular matrix-binding ebh, putative [Babesia ovata]|uniref:Extracellular matrix-binding ebh, putative n=1 Tax=Babesia ovata TaxID=189622 RepID=A0A2H6KD94_9APIC|nr:Extracellular matrix-binding ebh, putative [Babesia ovata]GBE60963.1 Extracellular matrix-binding ebh, putative [Babesia ovata]
MDESLKKDLRTVREEIKDGIKDVITTLQVKEFDTLVKTDLKSLRDKIMKLKDGVDSSKADEGTGLVGQHLKTIKDQYDKLHKETTGPGGSIAKETGLLDNKFQSAIQHPLNDAVDKVDMAIETLGEQFQLQGKKNIEEVFNKIKGEVGSIITGNHGKLKTGLEAVVDKVRGLAGLFRGQSQFEIKVQGWVENNILKVDPIKSFIEKYIGENGQGKFHGNYGKKKRGGQFYTDLNEQIAIVFKEKLTSEATTAGRVVEDLFREAESNRTVRKYVNALKEGCNKFVEKLGETLKTNDVDQFPDAIDTLVNTIVQKITSAVKNGSPAPDTKYLIPAVQGAVIQLLVVARQVAVELGSFALNADNNHLSLADNVDNALKVAKTLEGQLKDANTAQKSSGQTESPAKAVDSRLSEVRNMVGGLDDTFKQKVKKELQEAVNKLDGAVRDFDTEAQIREAAKAAYLSNFLSDRMTLSSGPNSRL